MENIVLGIPVALWMLIGLIAIICVFFLLLKRPIYEAMVVGFIYVILVTGQTGLIWSSLKSSILNTTTIAICTFTLVGFIFEKIGVMDGVLDFTYSLTGRLYGGAGWVTILCCAFMGALTGTVMASIAAVGVFAIPAMKKAGYRSEVAAATSISAGCFGPMIPPSTTIILSAAIYEELAGEAYNQGTYWTAVWVVAIWYILQRAINLILAARHDKITPVPKSELPNLKESFKKGWKALLIPVIIFVPFILYNSVPAVISNRLTAAGAKAFNSCILLWIPMVTTAYCLLIGRKKVKQIFQENKDVAAEWGKGLVKQISPLAITIIFAQACATMLSKAGIGPVITEFIGGFGLSKLAMALIIVFFFMLLGTVLSGTAMISVIGRTAVGALIASGVNPLVACAVLPSLAASSGLTPPMAAGMYACMGIAESGYKETAIEMIKYLLSQMLVAVLILCGILPLLGVV